MIDVIVPTRNRPELLTRALDSIQEQTVDTDITVYVVNDGGTDVSGLVRGYPNTVYLAHDRQKGCGAARNTGIRAGSGNLIAYLDDDDWWLQPHLEKLLNGMSGGQRVVYSDAFYTYEDGVTIPRISPDYSYELLLQENLAPVNAMMHERSLVDECGLFDEDLPSHQDYALWLRFARVTPFRHVDAMTCMVSARNDPERISLQTDRLADRAAVQEKYGRAQPKKKDAKILLFCPTYELNGQVQMCKDSLESFRALRAPEGVRVDRVISMDNPYPTAEKGKNILHQYQQAQKRALKGGYDALCTFEHDMIAPADGLDKLWGSPGEVVYGLYVFRHGAWVVNAFQRMDKSPNLGESLSYHKQEYNAAEKAGWAVVSGAGMGFTLIRRGVLEKINFRNSDESYPPDWALAYDCQGKGILQVARFDVRCGHIDEDGTILYVGKEPTMTVKMKVLVSFVGDIGKGNQPFTEGEILQAQPDMALDYVRAGFMKYVDPVVEVKKAKRVTADDADFAEFVDLIEPVEAAVVVPGEISQPPEAKAGRNRRRKGVQPGGKAA
jgi:hypothetical protein